MNASSGCEATKAEDKPSSVRSVKRNGSHQSGPSVTRTAPAAYPGMIVERINSSSPIWPCSGRGLPTAPSLGSAVVSYTAISPLPPNESEAVCFCGTFRRITPPRRYRAPRFCGARTFLTLNVSLKRDCSFYFRRLALIYKKTQQHFESKRACLRPTKKPKSVIARRDRVSRP